MLVTTLLVIIIYMIVTPGCPLSGTVIRVACFVVVRLDHYLIRYDNIMSEMVDYLLNLGADELSLGSPEPGAVTAYRKCGFPKNFFFSLLYSFVFFKNTHTNMTYHNPIVSSPTPTTSHPDAPNSELSLSFSQDAVRHTLYKNYFE